LTTEKKIRIEGMHCASCEVLVERKLRKVHGVRGVRVSVAKGRARVTCDESVSDTALAEAINAAGYSVHSSAPKQSGKQRATEIGAALLIVLAVYLLFRQFDLGASMGVTDQMSLGFIFVLGLVASISSCLAVTGGLLVAITASHGEATKNRSRAERVKPLAFFNVGRIIGYTALGALVGLIGSAFTLSTSASGVLTILSSVVMLFLGLQLLGVPFFRRFQLRLPKKLAHRMYDSSSRVGSAGSFGLGAATFFLPCGFTQALQLYVLASGSAVTGALTMLAFSLGTAPVLFGAGTLTATTKGRAQRIVLAAAAIAVIGLGLFNSVNGLALTGVDVRGPLHLGPQAGLAATAATAETNGVQTVRMRVVGYEYFPSTFTVTQGVPVEWVIDARQAAGCARVITAPSLGITEFLSSSKETIIRFTPSTTDDIRFSCTMGMTTPGAHFNVLPNENGVVAVPAALTPKAAPSYAECDPTTAMCIPPQELFMEITREKGFYPSQFEVRAGLPVELTIDAKVVPSGCMSAVVIPGIDVGHQITAGVSTMKFTAPKPGVYPITCSMGSRWGQLVVV
jgi:sulfite exporter TauE/SafE/copper chaperone CopZ